MYLSDILTPELVQVGIEATSKKRLLEHISDLIAANTPQVTSSEIFEALLGRERLGATGMGHGVAVPHARLAQLEQATGCLILLKDPIDYDAMDGKPVNIVFGLLVPEQAADSHLQLLADIAEKMNNAELLQQLSQTNNPKELFALITKDKLEPSATLKRSEAASHHS